MNDGWMTIDLGPRERELARLRAQDAAEAAGRAAWIEGLRRRWRLVTTDRGMPRPEWPDVPDGVTYETVWAREFTVPPSPTPGSA